jgi:creatinine amidohydrolase/Fe(II)-dependent formamide hydrolase-like protein
MNLIVVGCISRNGGSLIGFGGLLTNIQQFRCQISADYPHVLDGTSQIHAKDLILKLFLALHPETINKRVVEENINF